MKKSRFLAAFLAAAVYMTTVSAEEYDTFLSKSSLIKCPEMVNGTV